MTEHTPALGARRGGSLQTTRLALLLWCFLVMHPGRASGAVPFELRTFKQIVPLGSSTTVEAQIANPTSEPVWLTGLGTGLGNDLLGQAARDSALRSLPTVLMPGESWAGHLLTLSPEATTALGKRMYELTLFGGPTPEHHDDLTTVWMEVEVIDPACAPQIQSQPISTQIPPGQTAQLVVTATAPTALSYQWRRDGAALIDAGRFSGTATAHLAITSLAAADTGIYDVEVRSACGTLLSNPVHVQIQAQAGAGDRLPRAPGLNAGWPNPFHGSLAFRVELPRAGYARVEVCDVTGRVVALIREGHLPAGTHQFLWLGTGRAGRAVPAGVYWLRLKTELGAVAQARVVRLR